MTDNEKTQSEKFTVSGDQLVEKIKQLIHEGNIRKVRIIHKGKTVLDIPLTIGASSGGNDYGSSSSSGYRCFCSAGN